MDPLSSATLAPAQRKDRYHYLCFSAGEMKAASKPLPRIIPQDRDGAGNAVLWMSDTLQGKGWENKRGSQ